MNEYHNIETDLILEVSEGLTKNGKTLEGVYFKEEKIENGRVHVTDVEIRTELGARQMGKPKGKYITLESGLLKENCGIDVCAETLSKYIKKLLPHKWNRILAVGLGNRELTVDSLGPKVIDNLFMTYQDMEEGLCGLAPGVMAQTGMETADIIKGVIDQTKPDAVIVIDALAARSIHRLGTTIQLTNTGITPGSGVGNHRNSLTESSLGIPVLAIGVPMIVRTSTIVYDTFSSIIEILQSKHTLRETGKRISEFTVQEKYELIQELLTPEVGNLCVTPKDIDELVFYIGKTVSRGINKAVYE